MRNDVIELENAIHVLQEELRDIRKYCPHHNIKYKYEANTGNWCEVDDRYWVNIVCKDCGARLTIYSDEYEMEYKLRGDIGSVSKEKM